MGIIFLYYSGTWEDEARAEEYHMNERDYALGHGRRGREASLPPAKPTEEVEGGAGDHPHSSTHRPTTHIQGKSRGMGTWTSHGPELVRQPPKLSGAFGC